MSGAVALSRYMACTTSLYGAASLTNRAPAALTMRPPGRVRSARQKYGSPGSGIVGPHHASSIRSRAAPMLRPASIPSPVFAATATVQSIPMGCCSYLSRMARLCSKPPEPTMTPRVALICNCAPPCVASTPVTRPAALSCRLTSGVLSHTGTLAESSPAPQPAGESRAHGERLPARQDGRDVPADGLGGDRRALHVDRGDVDPLVVGAVDDLAGRDGGIGRGEGGELAAEGSG